MNAKLWAGVAALIAGSWASGTQESNDKREPPMIFFLEVEGKKVPVEPDKTVELETKSPTTKVTLRVEPHRVFNFGGIRFHYPREMGFEADLKEANLKMWTLDGNDAVLMLQRFTGEKGHLDMRRQVIEGMIAQYGRRNVKTEESVLTVQKKRQTGTTVKATIAGTLLSQSVYSFPAEKGCVVLILQDSLTDEGNSTPEFLRLVKMIEETMQLPKEGR